MQELLPQLVNHGLAILVALLGALVTWVGATIQAKVKNDLARGVMKRLESAVENAVHTVGGTLAKEIKEASEDGVITADEAKQLREHASSLVKLYLGENGTKEIEKIVGADQLEEAIFAMIEAKLQKLKGSAS